MAAEADKEGGYSIVLTSIRGGANLSVAAAELSRIFSLDLRVATQIIRKAPIILFKDVPEKEVQAGKAHLVALSRFGMDFRVTQAPPVNVPKVNWPSKPDLAAIFAAPPPAPPAPVVASPQEVTVQLLCPCCGSTLRMRIEPMTPSGQAVATAVREEGPETRSAAPAEPKLEAAALEPTPAETVPAPVPAPEAPAPTPAFVPAPAPEPAPAPTPVAALAVAESEADRPWAAGPYAAVPVDRIQEDLEFSRLGGAPLYTAPLFVPPPPAPPRPKSSPALAPAPRPKSSPSIAPVPAPEKTKTPLPPAGRKPAGAAPEEQIVEVEARDASAGVEEVEADEEKVMPVEPEAPAAPTEAGEAGKELEPWTGPARVYEGKDKDAGGAKAKDVEPEAAPPAPAGPAPASPDEVTRADEDLQPWTGSARSYRAKDKGKAKPGEGEPGAAAPPPAEPPPAAPREASQEKEDDLQPWSGPARSYKPKDLGEPKPREDEPEASPPAPAPAPPGADGAPGLDDEVTVADADLQPWTGSAHAFKRGKEATPPKDEAPPAEPGEPDPTPKTEFTKAIEEIDNLEGIPEINLAEPGEMGMNKALTADVEDKARPGLEEGLEDVPEIQPAEKPPEKPEPPPPPKTDAGPPRTTVKKIKLKRKGDTTAAEPLAPAKAPPPPEPEPAAPAAEPAPAAAEPAPAKEAEAEAAGEGDKGGEGGGEGDYSVFLSKIVSSDRRRKAVELLCDIKGITEKEAEGLTNKMIIPVVKGVDKDKAESILEQFKKNKISGRITRKK